VSLFSFPESPQPVTRRRYAMVNRCIGTNPSQFELACCRTVLSIQVNDSESVTQATMIPADSVPEAGLRDSFQLTQCRPGSESAAGRAQSQLLSMSHFNEKSDRKVSLFAQLKFFRGL
jgi:hypothetical protein